MPYDHTQLHIFQTCPEKYRLTFLEQLEHIEDQPSDQPLRFGEALHAGLAAWYKGSGPQVASDCFLAKYPTLVEGKSLYTPQHGLHVLQDYLKTYGEVDKRYTVLAVEIPVMLLLQTKYLVKLDTVVEDTNGIWVLEHKSTAASRAFTDAWWAQFEPNSQLSGQVVACVQQFGRCDGVILNGIGLSYGVRKGFEVRFERQIFTRTEEQLKDWKLNIHSIIARMEEYPRIQPFKDSWEKNESACTYCSYRPLCMSCGSEGVKEALFRKATNVFDYQLNT